MESSLKHVKPLDDQAAIDLGAEIVGEIFVFGVASAVLITEYTSSAEKQEKKEAALEAQLKDFSTGIKELREAADKAKQQEQERTQQIAQLQKQVEDLIAASQAKAKK